MLIEVSEFEHLATGGKIFPFPPWKSSGFVGWFDMVLQSSLMQTTGGAGLYLFD